MKRKVVEVMVVCLHGGSIEECDQGPSEMGPTFSFLANSILSL